MRELSRAPLPPLVDRQEEVARIAEALDAAERGKGQLLLLRGEAGCGKTRLLQEAVAQAARRGFGTGSGTALSESVVPYHPWKEALAGLGLNDILEEHPPPKVLGLYVATEDGEITVKVEREVGSVAPATVSAIRAIACGHPSDEGELREHGRFSFLALPPLRVVLRKADGFHLAAIVEGREDESLLAELRDSTEEIESIPRRTVPEGKPREGRSADTVLRRVLASGKYDGIDYAHEDPKLRQGRLFEHVALGVSRLAEARAQLVAIDDIQWADPSSLALMDYVARDARQNAVLVLGAYRIEEGGVRRHLREALARIEQDAQPASLLVSGLPRDEMRRLVEVFIGPHALPTEFLDLLWRETQGYPLFIREVLRGLQGDGAIRIRAAAMRLERPVQDLAIPRRVREAIRLRIEKLPKEERQLLDAAAACGTRFTTALLARVAGEEETAVVHGLNNLARIHGLVRAVEGGYAFDHPAVQEVAYESMPQELRRARHREAAQWLELVGGPTEDIAEHYYRSGDPRAGPALEEAAGLAAGNYGNDEAIRLYQEALEIEKSAERRAEVFERVGQVHRSVGELHQALAEFRQALELQADSRRKAGLCALIAATYNQMGAYKDALEWGEKALEHVGDTGCTEEGFALNVLGIVHEENGELEKALDYWRRSLAIREKIGDQAGISGSLNNIANVLKRRGDWRTALGYYERAAAISESIGHLRFLSIQLANIGTVYDVRGDFDTALQYYRRSTTIAERIGDRVHVATNCLWVGWILEERGEYEDSLQTYEKGLALSEKMGLENDICRFLRRIGSTYHLKGDDARAVVSYHRAAEIAERLGNRVELATVCEGLAEVYLAQGKVQDASDLGNRAFSLASNLPAGEAIGPLRVLGMICREKRMWRESIDSFEKSIEAAEETGTLYPIGRTCYEFGLMWESKGEFSKAKEYLDLAIEHSQRLGARTWLKKAKGARERVSSAEPTHTLRQPESQPG